MPDAPPSISAELVADCGNLLGEGPVWSRQDGQLYWVDISAGLVWRTGWPDVAPESWAPPSPVTALAPRAGGGFVVAARRAFGLLNFGAGTVELLGEAEPDLPGNRFNDGKVDGQGAFWAGTMDDAEHADSGSLYRLDERLRWQRIDSGYRVTNGPAFSPDGAFIYHTDSARRIVYRFPLRDDGTTGSREIFLQFSDADGYPDGMTTDTEGCLWIAFWDGWCVRRFTPSGLSGGQITLPVQRPTSCAFGGAKMDMLFITSARTGLSEPQLDDQPLAGGLFVAQPAVKGRPEPLFKG